MKRGGRGERMGLKILSNGFDYWNWLDLSRPLVTIEIQLLSVNTD